MPAGTPVCVFPLYTKSATSGTGIEPRPIVNCAVSEPVKLPLDVAVIVTVAVPAFVLFE